tara:strand:+ start:61 stop:873 length:813 start_codon:yes stop_codon:yes gene_type:complete
MLRDIPFRARGLGAEKLNENPVSYDKTRISGSSQVTYILHSKGGCMPGQQKRFTPNCITKPREYSHEIYKQIFNDFKRERYLEQKNKSEESKDIYGDDKFTYNRYCPYDDEILATAIKASYRQVFGNLIPMESELANDSERRLRNGDIVIRDFIRSLAKSDYYKSNFFINLNQSGFVSLNFKHLLGRAVRDQTELINSIKIINNQGFDAQIDYLIDSIEYEKVFGAHTVPFQRCCSSMAGLMTNDFIKSIRLYKGFASSDNVRIISTQNK